MHFFLVNFLIYHPQNSDQGLFKLFQISQVFVSEETISCYGVAKIFPYAKSSERALDL